MSILQALRRAPTAAVRSTPLLARSSPLVPALATHARAKSSRSRSRMQNDYSWYGEQAHATTILSVRKDNKVVRK